jgi:uncharacterized membrane protein YfcA
MRLFPWLVMFCAAFSAGAINSIAGGGTLITFPVLIWLGLDPKVANGTSTVALWPGLFGGLFGYRKELENSSTDTLPPRITSVIGGAVRRVASDLDAVAVFAELVPFLILFATDPLHGPRRDQQAARLGSLDEKPTVSWWTGAIVFQFFSAMYGGYFGAGNGILMLAAMGCSDLTNCIAPTASRTFSASASTVSRC